MLNKELINKIVWWIPKRELRNNIRNILLSYIYISKINNNKKNLEKFNDVLDFGKNLYESKLKIEKQTNINFQSEIEQDFISYLIFSGKKKGFFIDIGANDGIKISNTYFFEKLGWSGICVEANPIIYEQLEKNRNCDLYNAAILDKKMDSVKLVNYEGHSLMAKIDISESKENSLNIKSMTFDELMYNYKNISSIDLLSIDVEGFELNILKTIDFNKYDIKLIIVENNEKEGVLEQYMKSKGYRLLIDIYRSHDLAFVKD
ncbi:putative methyltransferase FkbM family [Brachyspira intermedia PWS/A]|uniref:Putative methyltransferase FkbM family n=1 Tax=Brachyspira intermedia (strain ATCC 51140 / PWS/A) TaxID=1045858 RepID=G0EM68_BRAIP|nr:FkbM family methyltransferase [Brachyspira intermedia]AEM21637.1 putative methyltransferase FkbM family [Brachyspira intermedia PWS/A]